MNKDLLELTKKLISFKSTSYNELELMQYLSCLLKKNNIKHVFDEYSPIDYTKTSLNIGRTANIYVQAGSGKRTLIFYSHTDVVDGNPSLFKPVLKDNKLYGRGASDMKSALAGLLYVLLNNYDLLNNLPVSIIFAFISDEETSATGIKRFVDWIKAEKVKGPHIILMEPTEDFSLINKGGKGYIFLNLEGRMQEVIRSLKKIYRAKNKILSKYPDPSGEFGYPTCQITKVSLTSGSIDKEKLKIIEGKTCHASQPDMGVNAIEEAFDKFRGINFLITNERESPNSIPSLAFFAVNDTRFSNLECIANIDIRTNPAADRAGAILKDVRLLISKKVKVSIRDTGPAFVLKKRHLIDICVKGHPFNIKEVISTGGSDAPYLFEITENIIPGFGPGKNKLIHADNEYIDLDVLESTPQVIKRIINNFIV